MADARTWGPFSAAVKAEYSASTAWMPMQSPGTLKVSNMISAAISRFSGGFSGGSVRMKLWSSLSTRKYLLQIAAVCHFHAAGDVTELPLLRLWHAPITCSTCHGRRWLAFTSLHVRNPSCWL